MIHLVTDSTAYLPPEIKARYNVHTISLKICVGDQTFDEDGGITKEEFFRLLAKVETTPTTSQPSAGEFIALYQQFAVGDDEVVSVHISSGLSGTVPNALAAAQEVAPDRISVVDSRTTAIGLVIMVVAAGEALAAGRTRPQVVSMLERMVRESVAFFSVEDLAYLQKGGRINTAARLLGTLMNIKPILYLNEGKIEALDKVRTTRKARMRLLDEVEQRMAGRLARASVTHVQAPEAAAEIAALARQRLNCKEVYLSELGPAIGSHTGPGLIGIAACPVGEDGF
jgi:DegV family protein with EDD domain